MMKSSLIIALFAALVCLSSGQVSICAKKCNLHFRCTPYYKDLVWSIVDGTCRVFQNGCLFGNENCNRQNNCQSTMEMTTREKCLTRCNNLCPFGGTAVCAAFPYTNEDGTTGIKYKTFLNICLLNQFACENEIAYVWTPTEGECQ